ncbi:MAG: Ig-like domain repeat protein [Caldilineaceae bacterium]
MNNLKKIGSLLLAIVVLSLTFFLTQSAAAQVTVPAIVYVRTDLNDDPAYTGKAYQMAIWSNVASAAKPITVIRRKAGIEATLATITSADLVTPAIIPVTFAEPGVYTIFTRHADVSDVNAITDRTVVAGVVITLTSNSPTQVGASASFTATVEQYGAPATSGVITFTEGATTLAVGTVDGSGVATWSTSALAADEYLINATYDDGSTATVLHTVTPLDICFATHDDGGTLYSSSDTQAVQQAVDAASAGDTIKIAGTCAGVGALPLLITIPLTLSGGYTTSNWLTADAATYPTTLDGSGSTRVLSITGEIAVTLQGLTLQNGDAGADDGGCLYIDRSTVTLNDTTITGCQAVDGGGVRVGSTLILNAGTVISGNTAAGNGGGILVNGTPTATLIIQGGEVLSNTAVNGGGVAVLGSGNVLTMTSGAISYNVAQGVDSADDTGGDGLGGGLYNTGAVWLTGGVLQTNLAEGGRGGSLGNDGGANGGNGRGGAIYNDGVASLTVANVILAENAAWGGAGYSTSFNTGGNGGDAWGGAIDNNGALTLSDTELRNNLAQGVTVDGAALMVVTVVLAWAAP